MRHKTARERADGTGWHYVSAGRNGGHPIGLCAQHPPHPTEAEARDCYGTYLRESIRLDVGGCSWTSCQARPDGTRCPNPAQRYAQFGDDGYGLVALCPDHMAVDHVVGAADLAGPAGDAWVS